MKLFKNGIELKYILLIIGIVAASGVGVATTSPIIGDGINYLDAINITRWSRATQFIDADNVAYYVDPANAGRSAVLLGNVTIGGYATIDQNTAATTMFLHNAIYNGTDYVYRSTDDASMILFTGAGDIYLRTAASGTAGNAITWNDALVVTNTGLPRFLSIASTSGTDDIGCIDPTTKELTKNTGSATTCAASSEKVKHSINTKPQDINLNKVRPVNFVYNNDKSERVRTGFIAEEFCVYYPETCYTGYQGNGTFVKVVVNSITNKADGFLYSDGVIAPVKGVEPDYFVPTLTGVIQEQQFLIETQAAQIRNICTNAPQLCS